MAVPAPSSDGEAVNGADQALLEKNAMTGEKTADAGRHPFWLRPVTLATLTLVFLAVAVTPPVLLNLSQRNQGLSEAQSSYIYAWRFGPTAVFTLITIFWTRVEAQASRSMPWIALESGNQTEDVYSLDYTQMFLPLVLFQSLRRKHHLVFLTSVATIMLRVQIILSPNIFDSAIIQVSTPTEILVKDSFVVPDDPAPPDEFTAPDYAERPYLPYNHARALQDHNLKPPFGMTSDFVYQTFGLPNSNAAGARATVDAPIKATVDGLFIDMNCVELEEYVIHGPDHIPEDDPFYGITIDLKFEGCSIPLTTHQTYSRLLDGEEVYETSMYDYSSQVGNWTCSSLPRQHPYIFYFLATHNVTRQALPQFTRSAAVVCSPTTWMSRVEIVDDGSPSLNFTVLSGPEAHREQVDLDIWKLLTQSVPDGWADLEFLEASAVFSGFMPFTDGGIAVESDTMSEVLVNLTRVLGLMIAHYRARRPGGRPVSGVSMTAETRLLAAQSVCVAMCVLSGLCACIAAWSVFAMMSIRKTWKHSPSSLLGWAMLPDRKDIIDLSTPGGGCCRGAGEEEALEARWTTVDHTPLVLRPWLRASLVFFAVGVVTALITTLMESRRANGLMVVDDDENHLSLLWKSIPTLLVLLIAMYANASDTAIRGLVVFHRLSERACTVHELDLSLADMLGLRALYTSLHLRVHAVTVSQVMAMLCALLTTVASALLSPTPVPHVTSTSVQAQSWFGTQEPLGEINITRVDEYRTEFSAPEATEFNKGRERLRPLFKVVNEVSLVYPRNTYRDLVFPAFSTGNVRLAERSTIQLNLSAARLTPECHPLVEDVDFVHRTDVSPSSPNSLFPDILNTTTTVSLRKDDGTYAPWMKMEWVETSSKGGNSTTAYGAHARLDDASYMDFSRKPVPGATMATDEIMATKYKPWQSRTYVWGRLAPSTHEVEYLSVWRCNYTWFEVPTLTTAVDIDGELQIDKDHPPEADETKSRPWNPRFPVPQFEMYGYLEGAFPDDDGDVTDSHRSVLPVEFFSLIDASRSVNSADLMDPHREHFVLEALTDQLALLGAQLANIEHRLGLNETSASEPIHHGDLPRIEIAVVDHSRRRLVQNPAITYALIAIILPVVLVNTWALVSSWLSRRSPGHVKGWPLLGLEFRGLAPEDYNSIMSMATLLRGSNIGSHLPEDAHGLSTESLHQALEENRFRMGWFYNHRTREKVFTIGVMGDEDFEAIDASHRGPESHNHPGEAVFSGNSSYESVRREVAS